MTITAGFWNSHVHILPPQLLHAEQSSSAALTSQLNDMFTRWGFTTVFDVASILSNTNFIRDQIAKGRVQGPRILTVGEPFWGPGGTPIYVKQYLIDNQVDMPEVTSVSQAIARVDQQVHDGADGIKIFAGSIEADGVLLLPADLAVPLSLKPTATTDSSFPIHPASKGSSSRSTAVWTSSRTYQRPKAHGRPPWSSA
jgi:hypothetical protein